MAHPLARFAARIRNEREQGLAARLATAFRVPLRKEWTLAPGRYAFAIERWSIDGVVPIDRLSIHGAELSEGNSVDPDLAERIVLEALAENPQLLRLTPSECTLAKDVIQDFVQSDLRSARINFEEAEAARHYDLAATQQALIVEHIARRRREAEARIRELRLLGGDGRMRIARAEEGKLQKFLARMELKLEELRKREDGFNLEEPLLVGVVVIDLVGSH